MKKIFAYLCMLTGTTLLAASCNEELRIDSYSQPDPVINSFSPSSGPVGTLITVKGEGLGSIRSAKINGGEVAVKHMISGNEIVLQTTSAGSTGVITLENADCAVQSTEKFTYTYPTPSITTYPPTYTVGELAVFFGSGLDAIQSVKFNTTETPITEKSPTELIVKIPDLRESTADITFAYYDGSSEVTFQKNGVHIVRLIPQVTSLSPATGIVTGSEVTAEGMFLHLVEKVTIGDVEARITGQPENGQSLTFRMADDPSFTDGNNTRKLRFFSLNGTEILDVDDNFTFFVPSFYTWKNANLNAHSTSKLNHFFCLDTGDTYAAADFATSVDPLTMSLSGAVCSAKNQLAASVTAAQYYAVKPYIFFAYLGSGCYFYGPANNNNRISNFKNSSPDLSASIYGTPIILYRTLCEMNPAEKAIIDKIKGGTFSSSDFTPALLDDIDLTKTGAASEDGWSNIPNGKFGAFKAASATNHRPWAPTLTSATETVDINPGTVVLVMYFKPNWETFKADPENICKFGFIHITKLVQDKTVESGRQNNATFDVYWQRTPVTDTTAAK